MSELICSILPTTSGWHPYHACWMPVGASDLAGQMAAAFAAAALVFKHEDTAYSTSLQNDAVTLYTAATFTKGSMSNVDFRRNFSTTCISSRTGPSPAPPFAKKFPNDTPEGCISNTTRLASSPSEQNVSVLIEPKFSPIIDYNGTAEGFSNSTSFYDDLMWAAAWLAKLTGGTTCFPQRRFAAEKSRKIFSKNYITACHTQAANLNKIGTLASKDCIHLEVANSFATFELVHVASIYFSCRPLVLPSFFCPFSSW